jgi:hypothetical protein
MASLPEDSKNEIMLLIIIIRYENTSFTKDSNNEIILRKIRTNIFTDCIKDCKNEILAIEIVSYETENRKITKQLSIIPRTWNNTLASVTEDSKNEIMLLVIVS